MEFGPIMQELGVWGTAVLLGSMGFTQLVKRRAKRAHAKVPWWAWIVMPSVIAAIGVTGMVIGGITEWNMALLVWVVITFAGPLLYDFIIMPALRKFKK